QGTQRPGHVAGVRGPAPRAISALTPRAERRLADVPGVRVPGLCVGGGRGTRTPHRSWCSQDGFDPRRGAVKLLALGVDHRSAPAVIREALAFDERKCPAALDALRSTFPESEFAILSTCNRVEVYCGGSVEGMPTIEALTDFLAGF